MSEGPQIAEEPPEFLRARRLVGRCRLRKAQKACAKVLDVDPNNAKAVCLKARIDVALKIISPEQAQEIVDRLVKENPGDVYFELASAVLLMRDGDRGEAIERLRAISSAHVDSAYVHQTLAALLGGDKATWDEAWGHYKAALRMGPLLTIPYKTAAFALAKRKEPDQKDSALQGTNQLDRAIIRTRALGVRRVVLLFAIPYLPSLILASVGQVGLGMVFLVLSSLWGGWVAFTSFYVGCWKCLRCWIVVPLLWLEFALATSLHSGFWVVAIIAIVLGLALWQIGKGAKATNAKN